MVIEILSYSNSVLNPTLKVLILVGFILAALILIRCWKWYGGLLQNISFLLMIGSSAAILSAAMRLLGDYYTQFKWGESTFDLIFALITLMVALVVRKKLKAIAGVFESPEVGS